MADAARQEQMTFEQGYEELKKIVSDLDRPDVSVHDMFEGFRRGKGLETALREYLCSREGELTEIAEGKNLPSFEIVAPSAGGGEQSVSAHRQVGVRDLQAAPISGEVKSSEDDLPF
ncbi:MAG TPA: exodeoxyribonuclease VII small subunit [Solirubrobacteraceae bacterium]|jgi:exodeoxyribonuclease VII small subunit|nr:exodeoxyribonuclease VII small subunit [Solirubrobacteraceae bacterium]